MIAQKQTKQQLLNSNAHSHTYDLNTGHSHVLPSATLQNLSSHNCTDAVLSSPDLLIDPVWFDSLIRSTVPYDLDVAYLLQYGNYSYRMRDERRPCNVTELMESIEHHGVFEAIVCVQGEGNVIYIIDGKSRLLASRNQNRKTIPVRMVNIDIQTAMQLSVNLNIGGPRTMDRHDRDSALVRLWEYYLSTETYPPSDKELAKLFRCAPNTIKNIRVRHELHADKRTSRRKNQCYAYKGRGKKSAQTFHTAYKGLLPIEVERALHQAPFMSDPSEAQIFHSKDSSIRRRIGYLCKQLGQAANAAEQLHGLKTYRDAYNLLTHQDTETELNHRRQSVRGLFADEFIHGDCVDVLRTLGEQSVRLLLLDNPYGVDIGGSKRKTLPNTYSIPGDENLTEAQDLVDRMLNSVRSKLHVDAHILMFCSKDNFRDWIQFMEEQGFKYHNILVWNKVHGGHVDAQGTQRCFEFILHFVQGKPSICANLKDLPAYPRQVNKTGHPTPKPVELLCDLIKFTTIEGELVCDPFGGIASTACAALMTGRRFFSVEIKDEFYSEGAARLEQLKNSLNTP